MSCFHVYSTVACVASAGLLFRAKEEISRTREGRKEQEALPFPFFPFACSPRAAKKKKKNWRLLRKLTVQWLELILGIENDAVIE